MPWIRCDTRDPNSFSRAFYQQRQTFAKTEEQLANAPITSLASYISLPFPMTPKASGQLFDLKLLRPILDLPQDIALYILAATESSTIPSTIVGSSKPLAQDLLAMINSGRGFSESKQLRIEFDGGENSAILASTTDQSLRQLCNSFVQTVCTVEVLCRPSDAILKFVREQMGMPVDEDAMDQLQGAEDALAA